MQVSFTESNPPRHLPLAQSTALYRITQEALRNIARHAGTTAAEVQLSVVRGEIQLTISDSGSGFDVARQPGLGIISMRERASLIGASLTLISAPGKGTTIEVRLPFAKGHAQ
jgi:signal transduction histidine kinase